MTSSPSPGPSGGGTAAIRPADARAFAGRIDALAQGVLEADAALRGLGEQPLAVGTGADNRAIAGWYRELLAADTGPAARGLADELDHVRLAVRDAAAAWEQTEGRTARTFRPDTGPV